MRNASSLFLACFLALVVMAAPARGQAAKVGTVWIDPGIKVAYTLGEGFTYGLEISTVFFPDTTDSNRDLLTDASSIWGVVLNIDRTWNGVTKIRLGGEWVGPGVGLEGGPTLIFDDDGTHFGIGVTPWFGFYTMPFYTYTYAFGRPNLHEAGSYLKLYKCVDVVAGQCGDGDADGDDFD